MIRIKNEYLTIDISTLGAELQSIKDLKGVEYLWQGDARYWGSRATNIFPFVGRLENASYILDGSTYIMGPHGFARNNKFRIGEYKEHRVEFILESNAQLKAIYPYEFKYTLTYELKNEQINITYKIENKELRTMYCALGGHPGFNLPIANKGDFEDYYLEFNEPCTPTRILVSDKGLIDGRQIQYELKNQKNIYLNHDLYSEDAIILKDTSKVLTIKNNLDAPEIEVGFLDMRYIATWKPMNEEAQLLCIEPWTTLPGRDGVMEDISKFNDMNVIQPKQIYENMWWIKIKN